MKIAWVGWLGNENDQKLKEFLFEFHIDQSPESCENDYINLRQGRDFLKEEFTYDVVVICYIFAAVKSEIPPPPDRRLAEKWMVSDINDPEHWRTRLQSTQAKKIFAEAPSPDGDVGIGKIGEIPGYISKKNPTGIDIYTKL